MPILQINHKGNFHNTDRMLKKLSKTDLFSSLNSLAKQGVAALADSTPIDSGLTASSWGYQIKHSSRSTTISWTNTNTHNGVVVAILLQYGHGTGTGGYVAGRDYINPAIVPIFDTIADEVWKVVLSA